MGNKKINIVTLGCSKNVVDSEVLMKQLELGGWELVHDSNDPSAKVVVVNTCGFIADAKEESVDTIMNFVNAKKSGVIERLYVMGCLSQRYKDELVKEIPEVDGFYGVSDLPEILKTLDNPYFTDCTNQRVITTSKHFAFLKISEGCNWGCSYCAIPLIRGKHISKSIEDLVSEAKYLANQGVKELVVIAQDSTYYGIDLYGKRMISELLNELSKIDKIEWIRLHYAYPANFPKDLIETIKNNLKICKYIDIPFQHISDNMLKLMRRGITKAETIEFVDAIRKNIPDISIRTTFLVGHPGEAKEDFNELVDFVKSYKFDRVGVFTYSEEEDTHAAISMKDNISQKEKNRRSNELMEIQQEISLANNLKRVGQSLKVIVDSVDEGMIIGRTEYDSPEVDQEVLVTNSDGKKIRVGDFINVKITSAQDYDLIGEIL
ncbi:ribosomal protein S12 methylthiotransferase RimO [Tenuifilaceae bacterium CYCD]|nr:ribosomal protein S12 methylthiotransferase RimO [Tenuifilaceae bacterium CYCD]